MEERALISVTSQGDTSKLECIHICFSASTWYSLRSRCYYYRIKSLLQATGVKVCVCECVCHHLKKKITLCRSGSRTPFSQESGNRPFCPRINFTRFPMRPVAPSPPPSWVSRLKRSSPYYIRSGHVAEHTIAYSLTHLNEFCHRPLWHASHPSTLSRAGKLTVSGRPNAERHAHTLLLLPRQPTEHGVLRTQTGERDVGRRSRG